MILKWEIPELPPLDFEKDGKQELLPRVLTKEFTFSMHPKGNLRPTIEGWFGRALTDEQADGFDVSDLLGQECMMQILHEAKQEKVFARIKAIMPLPPNSPIEYQTMSEPVLFDVDEHVAPDGSFLVEIPEWIQKKVKTSEEYKNLTKLPSSRELGHTPQAQRQPAPQQRQAPAPAQAARPAPRQPAPAPQTRAPQPAARQPMQQQARRPQPPIADPEDDGRLPEAPDDLPM